MRGFIVASINKNAIKQGSGLVSEVIKYTPIVCEEEAEIKTAFEKQFPNQTILMTMPVETLRKNIAVIDSLAEKKGFELK